MRHALSALALLAAAGSAFAQETAPADAGQTDAPAETQPEAGAAEPVPGASTLSMGEPAAPEGGGVGAPYLKSEHGDWEIRCIRTESGNDPCQLYQLLEDAEGNSVAEFALFPLVPPQGEAIAGGNIVTPLETLLTQAVTMTVDSGEAKRYPFTFCTQQGCVARIGYAEADIQRFKRGSKATIAIVPVVAPDQRITLDISLSGFTAAYDELDAIAKAQTSGDGN